MHFKDVPLYILVLLSIVLFSVHLVVYNPLAYSLSFWQAGVYDKFSLGEPDASAGKMIEYFIWKSKLDLDLTDKERQHMEDVKNLLRTLFVVFVTVVWLSLLLLARHDPINRVRIVFMASKYGSWLVIPLLLAFLFFKQAFLQFHYLFFPQGNFMFPPDSYLITLLPEQFFMTMFSLIILLFLLFCWILQRMGKPFNIMHDHLQKVQISSHDAQEKKQKNRRERKSLP